MRRTLKKLGCAILCTCLLMINTPGFMSYAENSEQYAANADAAYTDGTETAQTATDAEDMIDTASETEADALLYAASPDVPEGGDSIEINSQADWDSLPATYMSDKNPVVIILNTDITLSKNTPLTFVDSSSNTLNNFQLYGNGHSIDIDKKTFNLTVNTMAIENVHIKNGTIGVQGYIKFRCTDSQFSTASVELYANDVAASTDIAGCDFFDCPAACIYSKAAPHPASFSDCNMNNCGLLFKSANSVPATCKVSFSGITAENCTGTVLGCATTEPVASPYIIESISGCKLSTSQSGLTAIEQHGTIGKITGCTITGFDTGISLYNGSSDSNIKTLTISDTKITDCITGVSINNLQWCENTIISNLTLEGRKGASNTVGYQCTGSSQKTFLSVDYDFAQMPQIKSCHISGFDTGIDLKGEVVVSDCEISDCKNGINISNDIVAIVDTTLKGKGLAADSTGVTTNRECYLIDCDINDFNVGSDLHISNLATIIGCRYQNRDTNLISAAQQTTVYDTSFIGGETSISTGNGTSYLYGCVVEGNPAATKVGVSMGTSTTLHVYSLNRPYDSPYSSVYDKLKKYSDRTVNNGKSEIVNCETGIDSASIVRIADTHIYDCGTGIKSSGNTYSYGNNLIEDCKNGIEVQQGLYKNGDTQFTEDTHDTIRNCSNDGLSGYYITASPAEWRNRLEIYNCGNYGIKITGDLTPATVDIHDCKTGIYMAENSNSTILYESKVYDNKEWNIYDGSNRTSISIIMSGSEGTLTSGGIGNVYSNHSNSCPNISTDNLYSDDSVYYLGQADGICAFSVDNLYGTVVFDTVDSGYILGRRIAVLSNPDLASQMFAKKDGFVISTEKDGNTTYAVFAAGCDVTYDVTTNGGDTFSGGSVTRISYFDGDAVDLTYTASKAGYEFVGWNTDKNATEGLTALTAEREDITLYAIYKKTAYINYHTYDAALDYRTAVTVYNNQDIECVLDTYNAGGEHIFVGYVLDENAAVSSADDVLAEGDKVKGSPDGLDVYCVYAKQGQLDYLKKDGTILSTERITVYQICSDNKKFVYTVRAGEPVAGFTFTGWKDKDDNSFAAGDILSTEDNYIVLTPVYVEGGATTDDSTTTTTTTTQPSSGPTTGDRTNPIGAIGLGFLSLLGILVLSMKNKRKN